jgi:hypothetical protein
MSTISDFFQGIYEGLVEGSKEGFNEVAKDAHQKYCDAIIKPRSDFMLQIKDVINTTKNAELTSERANELESRVNKILGKEKAEFSKADPKKTLKGAASQGLGGVSVIAGIAVAIFASLSIGTGLAFAGVGLFLFGVDLQAPLIKANCEANSELRKCLSEARDLQKELPNLCS